MMRLARVVAIAAAVALLVVGVRWGTYTAGGSDSYSYLNGAELLASGRVLAIDPLGADPTFPGRPAAFAPTGHVETPIPGSAAPIGPMGYSALMAVARLLGGRDAMFWVTPLFGALLVWWTFLLASRVTMPAGAAAAAVLTAASPIVLYQVVQPMNDIAAAAMWTGALVAATSPATVLRRALLAGLMTGIALAVRPNLVPLAAVVGLGTAFVHPARHRDRLIGLVLFGLAALPGLLFILAIQQAMFGSPFSSGYGSLDVLFSTSHVWPNAERYGAWLLQTQTPIILLAPLAPFVVPREHRRAAWLLMIFVAVTLACYLPYVVFDAWWFVRFLLPALPLVLILTAASLIPLLARVTVRFAPIVLAVLMLGLGWFYLHTARERQAFELRDLEARFRSAGQYVATLPSNALVLTEYQSGSVRFYSGRSTIRWSEIPGDRLEDALEFVRRHGRKPYLLFERAEEAAFKEHFAPHHPLGSLEWPPIADIDRQVRVFDPDDYARYRRGEYVRTEQIRTRRR